MAITSSVVSLRLPRGASLHIHDRVGCLLRVRRGRVWLTSEANPEDVILNGGEHTTIRRRRGVVVSAWSDALVQLRARAPDGGVAWQMREQGTLRVIEALPTLPAAAGWWHALVRHVALGWRRREPAPVGAS